jgi:hypothetical protein
VPLIPNDQPPEEVASPIPQSPPTEVQVELDPSPVPPASLPPAEVQTPSPWVQGQIDWAQEQGLLNPEAQHAAQSEAANNGGGEGANMCGIKPDATWYGEPC